MKKVRKTTRSFRYDINQIPYDYTVEVTNRFRGLDLIDTVPEELWMEVPDIVQEAVIKTIPKKKKCKKAKWLSEEALQITDEFNPQTGVLSRIKCQPVCKNGVMATTNILTLQHAVYIIHADKSA